MSKNATPPKKKTSGVNLFFVIHGYGVVPVFFQIGLFRYIKIAEHEPSKKNLIERESRMVLDQNFFLKQFVNSFEKIFKCFIESITYNFTLPMKYLYRP